MLRKIKSERLFKGTWAHAIMSIFAFRFFLHHSCYGVGNNVWKFVVSMMKIESVACIWNSCIITWWRLITFINGIKADEPVWNMVISFSLKGIEIFLNIPMIINIRFGENVKNNVWYTYSNFRDGQRGGGKVLCSPDIVLLIIHKNTKNTRAWPIIKIKFYIILDVYLLIYL